MNKGKIDKVMKESLCILVDTREKKNKHILETFDLLGIKYKKQKVDYGDYSVMLIKNEDLGILEDTILSVSVERKASLDEIGNNLTNAKTRFEKEMMRCVGDNGLMIIMIEDAVYNDIVDKKYKNKITEKQFLGLLHSIFTKYRVPFIFINKDMSALFIYKILESYTKNYLKNIK